MSSKCLIVGRPCGQFYKYKIDYNIIYELIYVPMVGPFHSYVQLTI